MMHERLSIEVIVLESDGGMLGKMHYKHAQDLAKEKGFDLVQVSKQGTISVCKILDRGKWLYEQKKKAKAKRHQSHLHSLKEIKFGMRIDEHDETTKVNHIKKFFLKGHDVRIVIEMRGRERAHPELAQTKLDGILRQIECDVKSSSQRKNSKNLSVIVKPVKPVKKKREKKHASVKEIVSEEKNNSNRQREERQTSSVASGDGRREHRTRNSLSSK